jgi:hypothetical protein
LAEKKKVFEEYGISWSLRSQYEIDHLISLELGGSNELKNLWPESSTLSNGSRAKDKFEGYLHAQVCSGKLPIQEAQREIATNWVTYYNNWLTASANAESKTATPSSTRNPSSQPKTTSEPAVKKSAQGICHLKGTSYYRLTSTFTPYLSLDECLRSGGRLPTR